MPNGPVIPRLRAAAAAAAVAGLLVAGCGSDDDGGEPTAAGSEQATAQATEASAPPAGSGQDAAATSPTDEQAASSLCDVVASVDLTAAFDDMLEFGEPSGGTDTSCTVPVVGAEGEGLLVQVSTEDMYRERAKLQDTVPYEEVDGLGSEAYLINEADLNVLLDDGTAIQAALSVFFVQNEPPPAEILRPGLTAVAEAVVDSR